MAMLVLNHYLNKTTLVEDFKSFLIHDGVLSVAGGIVIGITSAAFIKTLAIDILLPILYMLMFRWVHYVAPMLEKNIELMYGHATFQLVHFLQELFVWVVAVVSAFLVLEFLVRRTLLRDRHLVVGDEHGATKEEPLFSKLVNVTSTVSSALPSQRPDRDLLPSFAGTLPTTRVYL